jgi:dTDP-glucose 4,6-dehydratase
MRVLVTGGAGFLGSHLCEYLLGKGYEVICMDNLSTGTQRNIAHLSSSPGFSFIKQDVTQYIKIDGPLDSVLHLASPASPVDYARLKIQTLKAGAIGTHNALGLALAKGARFLLASSSEVYGDPERHPQQETYWGHVNPIGPRGVYDEAKRFAEAITMAYHRVHGLDTKIARIFNTYGPRMRMDDGRALPNFISQALQGQDLTVYGDGSQTRSFCYVSDMIEGIYRLLVSDEHLPVNLGNPEEISVLRLAQEVIELSGSPSKIRFLPLPEDDPKLRQPDITRAHRLLDWKPKVPRSQGIKLTIEYFKREFFTRSRTG